MFNPFNPKDPALQEAIDSAYRELANYSSDSDEYQQIQKQLTALYALKKPSVDPNKLLLVAGNVFIGIKVLQYEKTAVVTTKLWSFLSKL